MGLFGSHYIFLPDVDNFFVNFLFVDGVRQVVFPCVEILGQQITKYGSAGHIANCFSAEGGAGEIPRKIDLDISVRMLLA